MAKASKRERSPNVESETKGNKKEKKERIQKGFNFEKNDFSKIGKTCSCLVF
ncbi:hypothetical protein COLO4_34829 [Corchorus olitorius]|uniref:Uncharacterized protein n=1 Tax=Corchorus olitorius TaxID=93759 RepID=A0A1R3GJB3_9ROSI|nr:hypothetical protein COLO4_34829 [Corchorus olitorius]